MKTITYNLREKGTNYYNDIGELADRVLEQYSNNFARIFPEFTDYITNGNIEPIRSYEEYVYDFLSAGVYMNTYSEYSNNSSKYILFIQRSLYRLRKKHNALKPFVDPLRGIISTAFLYNKKENRTCKNKLKKFSKLILWLEAAGEFREEVERIKILLGFLRTKDIITADKLLASISGFAAWFETESKIILGIYTANVESFIYENHHSYRWKEDYIFVGRKRIEYHLSMVGAELMNRGFRSNFIKTGKKSILVPACMRHKNEKECKAVINNFDMTCTGCSKECRINRLNKLGKEKNFSVHMIPHSSDFTKWLRTWAAGTNIGVIGVACPLNLITGGLELKSLDIPAQCVLLDYCGCNNHWDKNGFPTSISENELLKLLEDNTLQESHRINSTKYTNDKACNY